MAKKQKNKKKPLQKKKSYFPLFFTMFAALGIVLLPSAILLLIGMIPSYVAAFVCGKAGRSKALTVASVNLVGCSPILLELWATEHAISNAIHIVTNPTTLLVMYGTAALGYVADWILTNIISGVLYEQAKLRIESIKKRQKDLISRWGDKVKGNQPLDSMGFPLEEKK
jgi:fumarate reductase subunit D